MLTSAITSISISLSQPAGDQPAIPTIFFRVAREDHPDKEVDKNIT